MPLRGFDDLFREADSRAQAITVAAAGGADRTVLEALRAACDRGWVTPLVVGPEPEIRRMADDVRVDLDGFTIIDVPEDAVAPKAVEVVRSGRGAILMKGRVSTPTLLRAVLDPVAGIRTGRVICQVVLMEIVPTLRRFILADTGISIRPKLASKIEIMKSAVEVAQALGEPSPRVALMAATETPAASMPDTLHASELQRRNEAGEFPDCQIQGPLSFDLAYAADAADRKRVGGPVVGAADVMIFPDLTSANLTVKAIMYTANCRFGGILKGTSAPFVFMSRADTTETRLRSLALALGSFAPRR
jgi:phosphate butyryltransferase